MTAFGVTPRSSGPLFQKLVARQAEFAGSIAPDRRLRAQGRVRIRDIQFVVAGARHVSLADITSPCRLRNLVRARQIAMHLAKKLTDHTKSEIGRRFRRDHTTVGYSLADVEKRLENDKAFAAEVARLEAAVKEIDAVP